MILAVLPASDVAHLLEEGNRFGGDLQVFGETFPWVAVVVVLQRNADGIGAVRFEQIADKRQVAKRFARLFAVLVYHAGMYPDARKWDFACEMFGLRDLAGMMRESQVCAAAMNIDLRA